ncbi:MAG: diaminopimelate decarboxylase [Synergistaceae bacterium]|jgi:diaminopimelate decarboxylase|nr:diaminopimelate decarboxylase [Synergistaceae bacterium]
MNISNAEAPLAWGGVDCGYLACKYGTPLYVVDETMVRARCAEVRRDFLERWPGTSACYASKAFLTGAMARVICEEGLGLDLVSGGELALALRAGFPPQRMELHGNAKSEAEMRAALTAGVGRIIVDGVMELAALMEIARETGRRPDVLLRVAPGVSPHTHSYLATGQVGSKFGLPIDGPELRDAVNLALESEYLRLRGFHFHVGSQIFEPDCHVEAVKRVAKLAMSLSNRFITEELNFGGGFGVGVGKTPGDRVALRAFTDAMMEAMTHSFMYFALPTPFVTIEPGRWIVDEAGITLYKVETIKRLEGVTYVGVDGGMADNPRPSLYGAEYVCAPVAPRCAPTETVAVVGKCCESGDVLIRSIEVPELQRGDVLAVFNTGAYNFSMSSRYNRLARPAVVFVGDGRDELVVGRETEEDVIGRDVIPERLR